MYLSHKERLKKVLALVKNNQSELARIVGLPSANINAILKGTAPEMSKTLMIGIIKGFNEISAEWLLTGEGEMMKDPSDEKKYFPAQSTAEHLAESPGDGYEAELSPMRMLRRIKALEDRMDAWEKGKS